MEGLGVAANVIAVVNLSAKVLKFCYQYSRDVRDAKDDITRMTRELDNLRDASDRVRELLDGPDGARLLASQQQISKSVGESESLLRSLHDRLDPGQGRKAMRRIGLRALKWPFESKEAAKIVEDLMRHSQTMTLALQVDQTAITLDTDRKLVLAQLESKVAAGASYNSHANEHNPTCLENTRVDILEHISNWAHDPSAKAIFWLNGKAGTGKSTISRTVAKSFAANSRLGATFFFKRGESDRGNTSKFFPTIAADLARMLPGVARKVKAAIDRVPAILRGAMRDQFDELVLEPLSGIPFERRTGPILIVIDALDECDNEEDIKRLIGLFSGANKVRSAQLRIFLTSRPQLPIQLGFGQIEGTYQDLVLHKVSECIIEHDISTFLEYELGRLRDEYNSSVPINRRLPPDWPGQSKVRTLVQMASPLFIFAATACRFIGDRRYGSPNSQLGEILRVQTKSQVSKMDATYLPILNGLVAGIPEDEWSETLRPFRDIVGSIIILQSPLPAAALAQILPGYPKGAIEDRLDLLHSVLDIPPSEDRPVRLFHLSFRDFLLDPRKEGKSPFWIDEAKVHAELANNCLRLMDHHLRQDICQVGRPAFPRQHIPAEKLNACLSPAVQYACQYWVYHLEGSANGDGPSCEGVYGFLTRRFLHWIESLSLLGRAFVVRDLIGKLQSHYKKRDHAQLSEFLDDAGRFMLAKLKVIDATPLQIYTSLLVFSPEKSIIRTTFIDQVPKWISQLPEVPNEWGESLQTWEGHSHKVMTIAFSHNSTLVASGSWDSTVRIWRVDTGESLQTLKGHKDAVVSVVFSHNSALVASGSLDETVRIWRADTGACTQILQQGAMGSSIAFSHDSSLVASASGEKTIHIWRVNTGQCVQTITARNSRVVSVCFSHDSALLVAGSTEETVQIWRADAGEYMPVQILQTLLSRRRRHMVANIKVSSHDSALLASTSTKETVQIWRNDSGEYTPVHFLQPLEALRYTHPVPNIKVSFSHDSALLASITGPNGVVRIYRAEAGEYVPVQTFVAGDHLGTLGILSFAIRHDSVLVASRQGRHRLQLETWRADAGKYLRVHTFATGRIQPVSSAAISHDASLVAMGCRDSAICILPVNSGETAQSRDGDHSNPVMLAFSHDSSLVVSCGDEENTIKLWRSDTGELVRTLEGPSPIKVVALSHNSDLIAAASTDRFVRIWCADTGDCVQMITEQHVSRSIAFSHDSALLATVDKEAYVDVWRADTGGHVRTLGPVKPADSQSIECRSITFSRHSIFIAGLFTILPAIQDTQRIQIWRADTGQCVQTIIDGNMVKSIAFHSDLELLVSTWSGITSATWTWCVDTDGFVQSLGPHPRHTYCHLVSSPSEYMHTDCGTSHYIGGEWIAWNDEAVIMVPAEYTHGRTAISGSTIAFGTLAGEVTILGLSSRPCGCIAKMPAPKCIQVYKRSLGY